MCPTPKLVKQQTLLYDTGNTMRTTLVIQNSVCVRLQSKLSVYKALGNTSH